MRREGSADDDHMVCMVEGQIGQRARLSEQIKTKQHMGLMMKVKANKTQETPLVMRTLPNLDSTGAVYLEDQKDYKERTFDYVCIRVITSNNFS